MKVTVVGLGKLGLPLAALLSDNAVDVVGIDVQLASAHAARLGQPLVHEPEVAELLHRAPLSDATTDFAAAAGSDLVFLVVPTPSLPDGAFDTSFIVRAIDALGPYLDTIRCLCVASTVSPGSMDGPITDAVRRWNLDVGLAYSPQFIALGSVVENMRKPDFVLIGADTPEAGEIVRVVLDVIARFAPVRRMNMINAEITKIAVNAYITMKATFANVLADVAEQFPGGNAWMIADAVGSDSRIGAKFLRPGTVIGGPCLPRDSAAFAAATPMMGGARRLAEAVDAINGFRTSRLTSRVIGRRRTIASHGPVGILGLAYKAGTPVIDDGAGDALGDGLSAAGIAVRAYDPLVGDSDALSSVLECDIVVITTEDPVWRNITFAREGQHLIDCWGWINGNQLRVGVTREVPGVRT